MDRKESRQESQTSGQKEAGAEKSESLKVEILSLFPEYFQGPLDVSILKRAQEKGKLAVRHVNIRDFGLGRHKQVDDRPYGGGPGMVLMPGPVLGAIRSCKKEGSKVIYLSPQGKKLTAKKSRALAKEKHLILLCGHYEGIDDRIIKAEVDEEISIGDYVLTNGCLAALVLIDATVRFIPGVLGHEEAAEKDSFEEGMIFDGPHYTRPEEFEGMSVPPVLLNGHHAEIEKWRKAEAYKKTELMRPELVKGVKQ